MCSLQERRTHKKLCILSSPLPPWVQYFGSFFPACLHTAMTVHKLANWEAEVDVSAVKQLRQIILSKIKWKWNHKIRQRQKPSIQFGGHETSSSHLLPSSVHWVNFLCHDFTTCFSSWEPALNTHSKSVLSINLLSSTLTQTQPSLSGQKHDDITYLYPD